DGGIEALDCLEGALLETAVGIHQLTGAGTKRDRLALHCRRRVAYEQRESRVQRREDRDHGNPDHALARGDEALRAVGLRVDLVCRLLLEKKKAHDRGVNLEDVTNRERALRGVPD